MNTKKSEINLRGEIKNMNLIKIFEKKSLENRKNKGKNILVFYWILLYLDRGSTPSLLISNNFNWIFTIKSGGREEV